MEKFDIQITQRAFADLKECVLFVNNVSNEAAIGLHKEIMEAISNLRFFPNAYPDIEGLTIGGLKIKRMPIQNGRYIVLYKICNNVVTVLYIVDSRKDNSILKL